MQTVEKNVKKKNLNIWYEAVMAEKSKKVYCYISPRVSYLSYNEHITIQAPLSKSCDNLCTRIKICSLTWLSAYRIHMYSRVTYEIFCSNSKSENTSWSSFQPEHSPAKSPPPLRWVWLVGVGCGHSRQLHVGGVDNITQLAEEGRG